MHRALSRYGSVDAIYPQRSSTGHLRRVRLEPVGREITGAQFRAALNAALGARFLLSTNFDVSRSGDRYVFDGGGFGHGVGMSQYGAMGRARAGFGYDTARRVVEAPDAEAVDQHVAEVRALLT